ncbi:hypothetical protein FPZ54_10740 [Sphingomonas suaedae]|uniref:Uncharacterized protein n=1 Tax=Sphingomonas suaedae TaxID=2599297 RepID=A0A518RG65_9SPHN|nr:hypothetical protein [Sphingomonas suaedae]QDX26452.1 hypothetical protein FPZ54_10740 [Sphingomonas suaedae]
MRRTLMGAVMALMLTSAAQAQTDGGTDAAALERAKLDLEFAKLRLEQGKLEKEVMQAQIDALGFSKAEGKTTLGADAGKLEGWMLASRAVDEAAAQIGEKAVAAVTAQQDGAKADAKPRKITLLGATERLDLSAAVAVTREMQAITQALEGVAQSYCSTTEVLVESGKSAGLPVPAIIGAALSLLRTDTEISGFTVAAAEAPLIDAVVGKRTDKIQWVMPREVALAAADGAVVKAFDALLLQREQTALCRSQVAAGATTDAEKKAAAPKLAALDAMVARADAFSVRVSAPREGGSSELAAAAIAETLTKHDAGLLALRLNVSQAGGTLLKRANLWTALGAPAVGITGGLVVSWRLFNPADGSVRGGGVIVCRTALTNLNAIHAGRTDAPSCDWTTSTAQ